jgi:hypothetical protein
MQGGVMRGAVALVFGLWAGIAGAEARFQAGPAQYIAALGDRTARAGDDAERWGFWALDPGPRGVWSKDYAALLAKGGKAPAGWQYDPAAWWLEEHGLIMEAPSFPLPPGDYVVTGGREATAVLTIEAADAEGRRRWHLSDGATLYDVTHLGCRAAVYTAKAGAACTPDKTPQGVFPMEPGRAMPAVEGCETQDYQVLIVIGRMVGG